MLFIHGNQEAGKHDDKPFGGGGHISAAGLKYQTDNVEELKKQILDRVAEMKKKQ